MKTKLILFCIISFSISVASADIPHNWQFGFQDAATKIMEDIEGLHHFLMYVLSAILFIVFGLIAYIVMRYNAASNPIPSKTSHNVKLEIIWTIIPVLILIVIAIPSFRILSAAEHVPKADITIKVVGNQWYWTYTYPDNDNISFDSNMIADSDLKPGQLRLLEVDNRMVIPEKTIVRFLITGADVIHSFAVPSFGIKMDAVPGRINETWVEVKEKGIYYGQCSELCGVNHGFMPIAVEVVSKEDFAQWLLDAKTKFTTTENNQEKTIFAKGL
jgi:cytochrome c oxidase subunit 2